MAAAPAEAEAGAIRPAVVGSPRWKLEPPRKHDRSVPRTPGADRTCGRTSQNPSLRGPRGLPRDADRRATLAAEGGLALEGLPAALAHFRRVGAGGRGRGRGRRV